MMRALSTAATGMEAQQTKLDVTANNIANVSTAGFKKARVEFEDLMSQVTREPGAPIGADRRSPGGLEVGLGVRAEGTQRLQSEGDLKQTGNSLDVAIEGSGFFVVSLPSGEQAYTRDGALRLDAEGRIVTSAGHPLAGDLQVPPEAEAVTIGANGLVTAKVPGDAQPIEIGRIELASFVNPSGLSSMGHNLFTESVASGSASIAAPGESGTGSLAQGMLEMSNVKIVEEMIDLIAGQRAYEVNARVIKAADEMLQQASNLR